MDGELELKKLDEMVDDFAKIMKIKLHRQYKLKGWTGFDNPKCLDGMCVKGIKKAIALFNVEKKDMLQAVDVANYAMFVHAQLQEKLLSEAFEVLNG